MVPKKPEKIIREVAEQKDLPISTVDDIVSFYYKEVRKTLSSLEHININLLGLGQFIMKANSVNAMIKKYRALNNKYDSQTFTNYHNKKNAENKLETLLAAKTKIDAFVMKKKIFKYGQQTKRYLEEQKADNGGNQERNDP
jgi:hypothetical protein